MEIVNPISLSLSKQESESIGISVEAPIVLTTKQNGLARGYSAYEVAVKNGFEGTEDDWLASLVGSQGIQGADGINGVDGKSAYESALASGFVGTETEWLASLKGEQGAQGEQGVAGADGQDGTNGVDGQDGANGQSAYEIAVKNGFEGTEDDWLETLKEDGWELVHIDSLTTPTFLCENKKKYIVNGSTRPTTAIVPDSNIYEFRCAVILDENTHKCTITTPSGETLIGHDTSQIIPLVGGGLYLWYHQEEGQYHITSDTRQLRKLDILTENRDFSDGDGAEHLVEYRSETVEGQTLTHTLKGAQTYPDNTALQYEFTMQGAGTVIVRCPDCLIGDRNEQVISISGTGFTIVEANGIYTLKGDTRPKVVNTSITSYPLDENSTIIDSQTGTFFKQRTNSVTDSRFSENEIEQPYIITANPTDEYQLWGSSISDAGLFDGILPEGSIDIYWNLRRTGNIDINVYVVYSVRHLDTTETVLGKSNATLVTSDILTQYTLKSNHIEIILLPTDRIVIRVYARKDKTGTNPTLYQGVEGTNPTRSKIEVAVATLSHNSSPGRDSKDTHPMSSITGLQEIWNNTLDPTGFVDNKNIILNYDPTARTITLTKNGGGNIQYYWRGDIRELETPWVSPVHDNTPASLFLKSTDGENFIWSESVWEFSDIQITFRFPSGLFALREVHGLWDFESHDSAHRNLGTYRRSGGGLVAGTYSLNTNGNAACTPSFAACVISDEDIRTSQLLYPEGSYTQLYFTGSGTLNFSTDNVMLCYATGSYLYVNKFDGTNFSWTQSSNNKYLNLYVLRIPTTDDEASQKYRCTVVQPQIEYTTPEAALAESFRDLFFGQLEDLVPEFVAVERITVKTGASHSATGKIQIYNTAILYGNRLSQISVSGVVATTMENVSFTPYKDLTAINGQSIIEQLRDLSVEDSSNEDASALSINLDIEVQNINLISGTGNLALSLNSLPVENGSKSVIINNNRGSDVNIILPTENITSGGVNYVYHYVEASLTVKNGYSGEVSYRFHFLDETNCQIRIAGLPFDYKST